MSILKKQDHSYNNDEKLGQSYTFFRKGGLIVYLAVQKRGGGGGGLFGTHIYM